AHPAPGRLQDPGGLPQRQDALRLLPLPERVLPHRLRAHPLRGHVRPPVPGPDDFEQRHLLPGRGALQGFWGAVMEKLQYELDVFQGPLDLLLVLIAKNKIEITDIPIAQLLEQYMEQIRQMQEA